jgi:hypothetical protein
MNFTEIKELGNQWNSGILTSFVDDLDPPVEGSSNPNGVYGNRMWYTNDYMVEFRV